MHNNLELSTPRGCTELRKLMRSFGSGKIPKPEIVRSDLRLFICLIVFVPAAGSENRAQAPVKC